MSKKLLAALIALSMVGVYACDSESDDGDGGATGGSCTATVCENGTLKVCSQGKVITTKACENGCTADGAKCADPSQPAPACTESACKDDKTLNLCQGGTIIPTNCPTGCDAAAKKCKDNPNAPTCTADACKDATVLNKCEGGKVLEVSCPNGCEANACKQAAPADCKCDDGSACPNGDKTKCSGAPADCKCDDGSACPDGDKTKCSGAPADCKCDDGSACPDGDKTKCSGAPADCKCDDGSACPDGDKTKCVAAGTDPKVDDPCDKALFKKVCGSDGNTVYDCGKEGKIFKKDCADCKINTETNRYECADNRPDCTADSKAACKGACSADKKTGYFWSKELKTVDCSAKSDCIVDGTYVKCASSDVSSGACTAQSTSKCDDACSEDKLTRWYWDNKNNKVVEKKCKEATCVAEDQKSCVAAGSGETGEDCKADSSAKCNSACKADGTEGYYWDTKNSKLVTVTCNAQQKCNKNGTYINCYAKDLPAQCTGSVCGSDGNAYFCDLETKEFYLSNSGKCDASKTCKICEDGYGGCGTNCADGGHDKKCTEPKATTKGAVDACCDSLEYMPTCDGKTLNYCRSWGKVETKSCKTKCSVDTNTKKFECD